MNGSEFVLNSVNLLYYHLHKIILKRDESYIDSPELLKNKGATINPKSKDNDCFKYAITSRIKSSKHWEKSSKNI